MKKDVAVFGMWWSRDMQTWLNTSETAIRTEKTIDFTRRWQLPCRVSGTYCPRISLYRDKLLYLSLKKYRNCWKLCLICPSQAYESELGQPPPTCLHTNRQKPSSTPLYTLRSPALYLSQPRFIRWIIPLYM